MLKLRGIPTTLVKYQLEEALRHFAQPAHINLKEKATTAVVRFKTTAESQAFLTKLEEKSGSPKKLEFEVRADDGKLTLIKVEKLSDKESKEAVDQAQHDRKEYHSYLERVKKFKKNNQRQRKNKPNV